MKILKDKLFLLFTAIIIVGLIYSAIAIGSSIRDATNNFKRCIHCDETIRKKASKCIECLEWQEKTNA